MDKDKRVKTYTDDNGAKYQFDNEKFQIAIIQQQQRSFIPGEKKVSKEQIRTDLGKYVSASPDTVKSWAKGSNGPADLELVKKIAEYFNCNYYDLLTKVEDKNMTEEMSFMDIASEKQRIATRERVRDVYEALMEAIEKAHRFYYRELYDYNNNELVRLYEDVEYEDVEAASERLGFLLWKYMLDIPADLRKKIFNLRCTEVDSFLMDTTCAFLPYEDYKEVLARRARGEALFP